MMFFSNYSRNQGSCFKDHALSFGYIKGEFITFQPNLKPFKYEVLVSSAYMVTFVFCNAQGKSFIYIYIYIYIYTYKQSFGSTKLENGFEKSKFFKV